MKLRMIDRVRLALSGVVLLTAAAACIAGALFGEPVLDWAGKVLTLTSPKRIAAFVAVCAVLIYLGIYCVTMLWRKSRGKRGFVHQKAENGDIGISLKAIESLVVKCVERHEEISVSRISILETRAGLVIKLRMDMASGMNIPLAVGALQKQIRQYVTACSGVDVAEVRVQVDESAQAASKSPYAVPYTPGVLPVEQPQPALTPAAASAPVEVPVMEQETSSEEDAQEEERPMHQRVFGAEEHPAIVPAPPHEDEAEEAPELEAPEEEAPAAVEEAEAPVMDFPEEVVPEEAPVPEIPVEEPEVSDEEAPVLPVQESSEIEEEVPMLQVEEKPDEETEE